MIVEMILIVAALLVLGVLGELFPKIVPLLIIPMVCLAFLATVRVPDYMGYAVSDRFVFGQEAMVLTSVEMSETIYLVVKFMDDTEVRMVSIPNTEENKKKMEESDPNAPMLVRFGARPAAENGTGENAAGNFETLTLEESTTFRKIE